MPTNHSCFVHTESDDIVSSFTARQHYDHNGYFQPPPTRRQQGKTAADYRHLGRWLKFAEIGGKILYVSPTGVTELP